MKISKTKSIVLILAIFLVSILSGCDSPEPIKPKRYTVYIGNWVDKVSYRCDFYKRDGNTYQLFNEDSTLLVEIVATEGYRMEIERNW